MGRSTWRRKRRKRKIGLLSIFTSVALFLVIASAVMFLTDSFGFASSMRGLFTASKVEEVDPEGIQIIEGDYTINAPGEQLKDAHITGNLFLGEGIGEGNVDLINIRVDGSVLVRGGGLNSIFMRDCIFNQVKVNRPGGRVRLILSGETVAESIDLETGARLVENLSGDGKGVKSVRVKTDDEVELAGEFEVVEILVREAELDLKSETLTSLIVSSTAAGAKISYPDDIHIENMQLDGSAYLYGRGAVERTFITAPGNSELEGRFNRVEVKAEAGLFDLIEGSKYRELVVAAGALNNVFHLYEDVTVGLLELNEAVQVEGEGEIDKVIINAPGSTLEQIPLEIEFLREVSVMIAGYEITSSDMLNALREHGDPEYAPPEAASIEEPAPEPEPEQSSVPAEEPEPEPEPEEPEPDPEPGNGDDQDALPGFSLEILSPSENGEILTQGKNLLYVKLDTGDPELYQVFLDGQELRYLAEVKQYYSLVDKEVTAGELEGKIEIVPVE